MSIGVNSVVICVLQSDSTGVLFRYGRTFERDDYGLFTDNVCIVLARIILKLQFSFSLSFAFASFGEQIQIILQFLGKTVEHSSSNSWYPIWGATFNLNEKICIANRI